MQQRLYAQCNFCDTDYQQNRATNILGFCQTCPIKKTKIEWINRQGNKNSTEIQRCAWWNEYRLK